MADAKWSDDVAFVVDTTPSLTDLAMELADPAGTPTDSKVAWGDVLGLFQDEGTALEDIQAAVGNMDDDDILYGEEDGSPRKFTRLKILAGISAAGGNMDIDDVVVGLEDGAVRVFTRLQLLAGAAAAGGTPDSDDGILGLEDGAYVQFTRAQISAAVEAVEAHLVKSFGTTAQTCSNTAGRRAVLENVVGDFSTNDILWRFYLDNDDAEPVIAIGTSLSAVGVIQLGAGGASALDTAIARDSAGYVSTAGLSSTRIKWRYNVAGGTYTGNAPTYTAASNDIVNITAITGAINLGTNYTRGTPNDGDQLQIWLTSSAAAARAITWPSDMAASGTIALPSTTDAAGNMLRCAFAWDSAASKYRICGVS